MSTRPDDGHLVDLACALVRIPSVLGDEGAMAERVAEEMRALDFDTVEIDEAGNAVGTVEGEQEGGTVLLDAHLDTVDVVPREEWSHDPFAGIVEDGRIWGRGSSDMKGALAAMICAAARLDRSRLAGRVVVSGSVGEELIEGAALAEVMERCDPDVVLIGEASDLELVRAGRGRAEFIVETKGEPSHASSPDAGVNAVHEMIRVIGEIEALPMPSDGFVGDGVMCLTDMISVPYPAHSVVPSGCRATYERRLLPGETRDGVLAELGEACARGSSRCTLRFAETDYTSYTGHGWKQPKWFPPWELPEDHPVVTAALEALRGIGQRPTLASYRFCTNGAHSAGVAGVPTLGYGPSDEHQAHIVDESLEIDQLIAACAGYTALCEALGSR